MPKRPNVHRLASKAIHLADALESALEGKYEIGLIEAALGFSSFRVALVGGGTRTVAITSAVLRGGRASAGYAQRGHYLIVDGAEVRGVVNCQRDFKRLIKAGRIPTSNTNDEFFDMEASESETEVDIWANQKAKAAQIAQECQSLASELEARIRRRRAGHLLPNARAPILSAEDTTSSEEDEVETEVEEVDAVEAVVAGPVRKQITSARRLRKMALAAAAEEAARKAVVSEKQAERAALAARYAAEEEAERLAEEAALALARRAVPLSWEDEAADLNTLIDSL